VRLIRIEDLEPFGYLDDPKCRGPIEPGKRVEFDMWCRGRECFPEDPGPARGVRYPSKLEHIVFTVGVMNIDQQLCFRIESRDEDFFRKYPGFRPV
jgi:hypothetical protein